MADILDPKEVQGQGSANEIETVMENESTQQSGNESGTKSNDCSSVDILQQALEEVAGGDVSDIIGSGVSLEHHDQHQHDDSQSQEEQQDEEQLQLEANPVTNDDHSGNEIPASANIERELSQQAEDKVSEETSAIGNSIVKTSAPPLGSKNNPIRIIQQGNTYTSTQQLTQEQIQHIVQVLKRQNIVAKAAEGGSTSVYNSKTNTKIVYRVVQPNKALSKLPTKSGPLTARDYHRAKYGSLKRGVSRKRPRRESDVESSESDDEKMALGGDSDSDGGDMAHVGVDELSPTERLKKKREKPITRSGRVVKPPSHMVKDYKQIHRVDWYEDYDDDDGGYSDIYDSGNEDAAGNNSNTSTGKKKFPCSKCEKSYIGTKNLARHYRMTGHGDPAELITADESPKPTATAEDPNLTQTGVDSTANSSLTLGSEATGSTVTVTNTNTSINTPTTPGPIVSKGVARGRGKSKNIDGAWKPSSRLRTDGDRRTKGRPRSENSNTPRPMGRPPLSAWEKKLRREEKLNSALSSYSSIEVLTAIAPRLRKDNISLYDVLNAGLAAPPGDRPSYTRMLQLYTDLQGKMTELAQHCLRPITDGEQVADDKEGIQIATDNIAHSIGIEPGLFEVSDIPGGEDDTKEEVNEERNDTNDDTNHVSTEPDEAPMETATSLPPETPVEMQAAHQETDATATTIANSINTEYTAASTAMSQPAMSQPALSQPAMSQPTMSQPVISHVMSHPVMSQVTNQPVVETLMAPPEVTSASVMADTVSSISPGDIIQMDGQSIVVPEGANIVQTADSIIIYQNSDPNSPSVLTLKLAVDPSSQS